MSHGRRCACAAPACVDAGISNNHAQHRVCDAPPSPPARVARRYFVNNVLKIYIPCGFHGHLYVNAGASAVAGCNPSVPCTCSYSNGTQIVDQLAFPFNSDGSANACYNAPYSCLGTKVPFEMVSDELRGREG